MTEGRGPDFPLNERFELVRRLGDGGMGVVYEAYDRARNATVALKTLLHAGPSAIYRFKKEFRALADVVHPNLVTLHELYSSGDNWFFTMEAIEGVAFLAYVRPGLEPDLQTEEVSLPTVAVIDPRLRFAEKKGPSDTEAEPPPPPPIALPLEEARLRLALGQLALGLVALHDAGKLHRDIKPSNVMVTGSGRVVILDFGLATDIDESSLAQSHAGVIGTVAYLAPEMAVGAEASPASDWYAVGVMLYQALTGSLPFTGTAYQVLMKKRSDPPRPVRELAPEAPEDLSRLAMELLAISPKHRPTGKDVLRRLGQKVVGRDAPAFHRAGATQHAGLIGRTEHLAALESALEAATKKPTVVHLAGAPGIGKTALANAFLETCSRDGSAIVLAGRCFEHEVVPYNALDALIDALARFLRRISWVELNAVLPKDVGHLARIFPVLERVDAIRAETSALLPSPPDEQRRRGFAALRQLLGQLSRKRPVVAFIDDVQWGDKASADLLRELLLPPDPPPVLWIVTYPSSDRDANELLRVLRSPVDDAFSMRELVVGPLSQAAAETLAQRALSQGRREIDVDDSNVGDELRTTSPAFPPAEVRARASTIAREAEGNPLFVQQLALEAKAALGGGTAEAAQASLEEMLGRRYAALPSRPKKLLEILAVAGHPLDRRAAQHAAGLEAKDSAAITQLTMRHLARSRRLGAEEELECDNPRVRRAVLAGLTSRAKLDAHRQIAEALTALGAAPERILPHLEAAGAPPLSTTELVNVVLRKSRRVDTEVLERKVMARVDDATTRFEERRQRAEALVEAEKPEAADAFLDAAQAAILPSDQREMKRRAADAYLRNGRVELGLTILRPLLRAMSADLPKSAEDALTMLNIERSRLLVRGLDYTPKNPSEVSPDLMFEADSCWAASIGLSMVDVVTSAIYASRYLRLALEIGDPGRVARGLALELGFLTSEAKDLSARIHRVLEALKREAKRADEPYVRGFASLGAGLAALHEGQWAQTARCVEDAEQIWSRRGRGVAWELDTARTFGLWAEAYRGRFRGLAKRLGELIDDAVARGDRYGATILRMSGNATVIWLADDQAETAAKHLGSGRRESASAGYALSNFWELSSEVLLELYRGEGPSAWRLISKRWAGLEKSQIMRVQVIRAEALYLRARAALAATAEAKGARPLFAAARSDAEALDREGRRWTTALANLVRAEINRGIGLGPEATEAYREAEAGFTAAGMLSHAAAARFRYAELRRRSGRAAAQEAVQDLETLGIKSAERFLALLTPVRGKSE